MNVINAYVQASVTEKVWTTLGPEFGKDAKKTAVIVRALYGLKLARAAFRSHPTKCMESLGYQSCVNHKYAKIQTNARLKPEISILCCGTQYNHLELQYKMV